MRFRQIFLGAHAGIGWSGIYSLKKQIDESNWRKFVDWRKPDLSESTR